MLEVWKTKVRKICKRGLKQERAEGKRGPDCRIVDLGLELLEQDLTGPYLGRTEIRERTQECGTQECEVLGTRTIGTGSTGPYLGETEIRERTPRVWGARM
jgi:hypothetical protein